MCLTLLCTGRRGICNIQIIAPTFRNDRGGEIPPSLSPLPSFPSPLPSLSSIPFPFPPCPLPSCFIAFPFRCPYLYPFNPAKRFGERWTAGSSPSGSGRSPAAKRFWCIFSLKSAHFCHLHNDSFVIFTVHFGCVLRRNISSVLIRGK